MGLFKKIKEAKEKRKKEFLIALAEIDSKKDQYELARRYATGDGFEQNMQEAFKWYCRAVQYKLETIYNETNVSQVYDAWHELGNCFWNGDGIKKDPYLAFNCYSHLDSEFNTPSYHTVEEFSAKQKESLRILIGTLLDRRTSASADELYCLGHIFSDNSKNYAEYLPFSDKNRLSSTGLSYYQRAAELGHADALFHTASFQSDMSKSLEIIKAAADQGSGKAQLKLAKLYDDFETGKYPIQPNNEMAIRYYKLAASNSCINGSNSQAEAEKMLAIMANSLGDKMQAISWYQKHLIIRTDPWYHLDSNVFGYIGNMYKGMGNRSEALNWYNKGIKYNNDVECREGLRRMR